MKNKFEEPKHIFSRPRKSSFSKISGSKFHPENQAFRNFPDHLKGSHEYTPLKHDSGRILNHFGEDSNKS